MAVAVGAAVAVAVAVAVEGAAGGRREEQEGAFYAYLGEPRT